MENLVKLLTGLITFMMPMLSSRIDVLHETRNQTPRVLRLSPIPERSHRAGRNFLPAWRQTTSQAPGFSYRNSGTEAFRPPLNQGEAHVIGPAVLQHYRDQLARRVAARPTVPPPEPLPVTVWQAMSLLQKAVRRGRKDFALKAAGTLLLASPDRLWRRLGTIAFEDIGVADLDTLGLVTVALGGKRLRGKLGGEWLVASILVEIMTAAPKCRAADDLLFIVQRHPDLAEARSRLAELFIHQARNVALDLVPLSERALALWYVLGTDRCPSPHLTSRRGEPAFAFDLIDELGAPMTAVEITREGFRRIGQVLCPFVGLLMTDDLPSPARIEDDDLPPETIIGPLPSWSLDVFTREGKQAFSRFLEGDSKTARWLRGNVPRGERVSLLGDLVFFAEGGLLRSRLRWPIGDELRHRAEVECYGPHVPDGRVLLDMLRADLPELNCIRAEVMGSLHHAG